MLNLAVTNPNFSIVLPGDCPANCSFCFWRERSASLYYLQHLKQTLERLPSEFRQISITGGEPTTSKYLEDVLALIDKSRFPKVVLTTNGYDLSRLTSQVALDKLNHVNISRHHHSGFVNRKIFGLQKMPGSINISSMAARLERKAIDVSFNCVILPEFDNAEFLLDFVGFAQKCGVSQLRFRRNHGEKIETQIEQWLRTKYKTVYRSGCPVCETRHYIVKGFRVCTQWSDVEPSTKMKAVYELIFHPDGALTCDWSGRTPIQLGDVKKPAKKSKQEKGEYWDGCGYVSRTSSCR